jgi:hypothetical protein
MLAMGYGDVMPLSMLQHVQKNLEDYRNNGKKTKKTGDEFEERLNVGEAASGLRGGGELRRDGWVAGDEEAEIRMQVKQWEENQDVHDLTGQAVDLFLANVKCFARQH